MTIFDLNEEEEYLVLRKDIFNMFGIYKGLIIQYLINGNGEFVGSFGSIYNVVGIGSKPCVRQHLRELIRDGIVKCERIKGCTNRYTLSRRDLIADNNERYASAPPKLRATLVALDQIKAKKK